MCRAIVVRRNVIDRELRLEGERVLILTHRTLWTSQYPVVLLTLQMHIPNALPDPESGFKWDRLQKPPASEPDIHQPMSRFALNQENLVGAGCESGGKQSDSGRQSGHPKPKLLQHQGHQSVLLKAVTTTALLHDLPFDGRGLE